MAGNFSGGAATNQSNGAHINNQFALISLTSLFFIWGLITSLNDILIPHLKGVFELSYTQAMLVQFCFFSAYFLISIPAGKLIQKSGYQKGIVIGLVTAALGCLIFIPSAKLTAYWMFLGALFILASGITILQVAANPLVTLMGKPETASARLNMTQAFNSLGATAGPIVGGMLIFGGSHGAEASVDKVILPYFTLALILVVLGLYFKRIHIPDTHTTEASEDVVETTESAWKYKHLVLGAIGIFTYVGAEVSIGSFLVNYISDENIGAMTQGEAANYVAYFWGGALIGRFIGALIMNYIKANKILAFNSVMAILLLITTITTSGKIAMWSVILVGLFNSIMFPTIFSLAIKNLGKATSQGSGILCLAIVGGAIIPLLQGVLADSIGVQLSFILPLVCYVYISFYGVAGFKPQKMAQ
ncbi:sugar MFS transporter [Planctobacterium marinum]|uniref:Glucose/galactose MFS transporter n=1 Tax=Planctobacterium marinum TaxID=1631968 RepID=A0AA48HIN4_9ALTE|nr:glucose/galactose MFS transporter [Planctobacterium marinum]